MEDLLMSQFIEEELKLFQQQEELAIVHFYWHLQE